MSFDHRDSGTPEPVWTRALHGLAVLDRPAADDHVLVVAAHPDDETLGAGGLIAAAHRAGAHVCVVIASDGEASHPGSPSHSPTELATIRQAEVRAAIDALAPGAAVHHLGLPDGGLAAHRDALLTQLGHYAGQATLIVSPWCGDRHPDHEACARASADLAAEHGAEHWQYPIWAWHWGSPDDLPLAELGMVELTDSEVTAKAAAMAAHRSQHMPLSPAPEDVAILPSTMLEHFTRRFECFVPARRPAASSARYFDALYADEDDPWGLHERFYERRKRAAVLAALPSERFRRAFEPGCATGLLTAALAERCDEVVAWDVAERAVQQTTQRLRAARPAAAVQVGLGSIPDEWPSGEFDLIVASEVGYYCTDLAALAGRIEQSLAGDGVVLACHWRHPAADHAHSAQAVHDALAHGLHVLVTHVEHDFLLHVWGRSPRSVAMNEGIVA